MRLETDDLSAHSESRISSYRYCGTEHAGFSNRCLREFLTQLTGLVVGKGFFQLAQGVHHKGSAPNDGFIQFLT